MGERPDRDRETGTESPSEPQDPDQGAVRPREVGGRKGPEPTRFGDWEKNGRCIDF